MNYRYGWGLCLGVYSFGWFSVYWAEWGLLIDGDVSVTVLFVCCVRCVRILFSCLLCTSWILRLSYSLSLPALLLFPLSVLLMCFACAWFCFYDFLCSVVTLLHLIFIFCLHHLAALLFFDCSLFLASTTFFLISVYIPLLLFTPHSHDHLAHSCFPPFRIFPNFTPP